MTNLPAISVAPLPAAELAQQVLRVDPEALQKVAVLLVVDQVGKLLSGLLKLRRILNHPENCLLVELHEFPPCRGSIDTRKQYGLVARSPQRAPPRFPARTRI